MFKINRFRKVNLNRAALFRFVIPFRYLFAPRKFRFRCSRRAMRRRFFKYGIRVRLPLGRKYSIV